MYHPEQFIAVNQGYKYFRMDDKKYDTNYIPRCPTLMVVEIVVYDDQFPIENNQRLIQTGKILEGEHYSRFECRSSLDSVVYLIMGLRNKYR